MARELELFLTRLEQTTGHAPRRSGEGWQAHCPAHDDQRASLSIRSGTAGRVLVCCHAGCPPEAICRALELDLSALMPETLMPETRKPKADPAARNFHRDVATRRPELHRLPNERANGALAAASSSAPNARPVGQLCPPTPSSPIFPTRDAALRVLTDRRGPVDGCWEYHNLTGECVGLVLRWNTPAGKEIRPLARVEFNAATGAGGWVIGAMPTPRPLYALRDIVPMPGTASDAERTGRVYVVEGEKAADAGRRIGLVATTSSGGAAAAHLTDWSPLAGRDVVVLPDNDEPGRQYAATVVAQLLRLRPVPTIRQWKLTGLAVGGDLDDYIAARPAVSADEMANELEQLIDRITPVTPAQPHQELATMTTRSTTPASNSSSFAPQAMVTRLDECTSTRLEWLWPGRVPLGKLTPLIGDPGLGKSFVTLDVAARVSRGEQLPALSGELPIRTTPPGSVVLLSAEDDARDTILPRLMAAGADLARIEVLDGVRYRRADDGSIHEAMFSLQSDLALLAERIQVRDNCRLVVIDPITAYLGRSDSHRNSEMRALLAPLSELAARTGVAVLAVNHLNKMGQGPAIYRSMGSLAFAATARSVLAVMSDPHDAKSRVLLSLKSNVSAAVAGVRFRMQSDAADSDGVAPDELRAPTIDWSDKPVQMTAEEIIAAAAQSAECGPAQEEACEWLRSMLAGGEQPATELKRIAKEDGIRERTLLRAKARLAIVAHRTGFGPGGAWTWKLPDNGSAPKSCGSGL